MVHTFDEDLRGVDGLIYEQKGIECVETDEPVDDNKIRQRDFDRERQHRPTMVCQAPRR